MDQLPHVCPPTTKGTLSFEVLLAAQTGKLNKVKSFLEDGGDVNGADLTGMTMLFTSCVHGRIEVLRELLKHPNLHLNHRHQCITSLAVAAVNGHEECVEALLKSSLQCKLNLGIICAFKNRKSVTALSAAALAKNWSVFNILLEIKKIITNEEAFDILSSALEDDRWNVIKEIFQMEIYYPNSITIRILKEAYINGMWNIIELVFPKAIRYDNLTILKILNEVFLRKDWERMEFLLKVLSETVKVDIDLAEALRVQQHKQVEKMLKEGNYDKDTMSGSLLMASIVGTSKTAADMLLDQSHNYSENTLNFALILAAAHNRLEILPLLLQKGKFTYVTLGKARILADFYGCSDPIKLLKLSFTDKACGLFTNMKGLTCDAKNAILDDSDDDN